MTIHFSTNPVVLNPRDFSLYLNSMKIKLHRNARLYGGLKSMSVQEYLSSQPFGYTFLHRGDGLTVGVGFKTQQHDRIAIYPDNKGNYVLFIDGKPDILSHLDLRYNQTTKEVTTTTRPYRTVVTELKQST